MPERRPNPFDVQRRGRYIGTPMHWQGANWLVVDERIDTPQYGTVLMLMRYQDTELDAARRVDCTRPWWWTEERGEPEQKCACCRCQRPPGYAKMRQLEHRENGKRHSRYGELSKNGGEPTHAADPPPSDPWEDRATSLPVAIP